MFEIFFRCALSLSIYIPIFFLSSFSRRLLSGPTYLLLSPSIRTSPPLSANCLLKFSTVSPKLPTKLNMQQIRRKSWSDEYQRYLWIWWALACKTVRFTLKSVLIKNDAYNINIKTECTDLKADMIRT